MIRRWLFRRKSLFKTFYSTATVDRNSRDLNNVVDGLKLAKKLQQNIKDYLESNSPLKKRPGFAILAVGD